LPESDASRPQRILVIVGSQKPAARAQVRQLLRAPGGERLSLAEPARPLKQSWALLAAPPLGPESSPRAAMADFLARRAAETHALTPIAGWIVVGGETATAVLAALEARESEAAGQLFSGAPLNRLLTGRAAGALFAVQPGDRGRGDRLWRLIQALGERLRPPGDAAP